LCPSVCDLRIPAWNLDASWTHFRFDDEVHVHARLYGNSFTLFSPPDVGSILGVIKYFAPSSFLFYRRVVVKKSSRRICSAQVSHDV